MTYGDDLGAEHWEISVRAMNILRGLACATAGDVRRLTRRDLLFTPNCGKSTTNEIESLFGPLADPEVHEPRDAREMLQMRCVEATCV